MEKNEKILKPIIISASRSTDIPAFYSEWFINRITQNLVRWVNPFNRVEYLISFDDTRVVVFWSKNPKPIISKLNVLDEKCINYYFQFTLNDYDNELIEPNVPPLDERIETFKELSERIGKEKVIWRFDPLLLSDGISVGELLDKIENVGDQIHKSTEKLVISFIDIKTYKKVSNNVSRFNKENKANLRELNNNEMLDVARGLEKLGKKWDLKISSCGEKINLDKFNIQHNKCIDDELMARVFPNDKNLMEFLGVNTQMDMFSAGRKKSLKDKGQRRDCGCIKSKDIGKYNTCTHLCVYCYANTSENAVRKNKNAM